MSKEDSLGQFEVLILTAVVTLAGNAYGATIQEVIEDLSGGRSYAIGSVYTAIDRLEAKGFVKSSYGGAGPERGQRSKRFVEILAPGKRALDRSVAISGRVRSVLGGEVGS